MFFILGFRSIGTVLLELLSGNVEGKLEIMHECN
jgi:hypothetical protein